MTYPLTVDKPINNGVHDMRFRGVDILSPSGPDVYTQPQRAYAGEHLYPIETGIPVPPKQTGRTLYPFGSMQVGDSFFAPTGASPDTASKTQARVNASAISWVRGFKKLNRTAALPEFTFRRVTEKAVSGTRCWRIK